MINVTEQSYNQVETLIRKFKNLPTARRRSYNESDTRKDFILPLFRALLWNVEDSAEVASEEKVSRGFVDFSFRINGQRRFVLETKSLHEGLKEQHFKQARDYAYHKGLTWAVLSDFASLKVLNAEVKEPNFYQSIFTELDVDSYLSRFEELWRLSRPAMMEGVLDREAEKVFKKTKRVPITESLFDSLRDWRNDLYKNLRAYNKDKLYSNSPRMIDDAVQRILDRLIFIRTAEDRGVEEENLSALVRELQDSNKLNRLIRELNARFRRFDAVYNSQLFQPHYSEKLDYEPQTLVNIIEGLYTSPANYISYNFALIDADVLGRVYEQYLGYVTSGQGDIQAKRAKRKAQGIYYTPTFVVKYIVQQTLGRYLQEQGDNLSRPVRVLDLACGSGSFLIEAFDVLDQHLARLKHQTSPRAARTPLLQGEGQGERFDIHDYARQMQILTQNIYGVDKDEQAVEIAQLNLLLKALHVRDKLPTLTNVRHGDSLISGTPSELEEFFDSKWKEKNPFNWQEQFPDVFADGGPSAGFIPAPPEAGAQRAQQGHGQGFDVIIGNPPYVRIQTLPKDEVAFYNDRYAAATGNYDIYVLFIERALQLLKPGGVAGFILPNKFFNSAYGIGLRKMITDAKALDKIVDFRDAQIFGEATTYTCLLFLQKQPNEQFVYVSAGDWFKAQQIIPQIVPDDLPAYPIKSDSISGAEWNFSQRGDSGLLERISIMPIKLTDVVDKIAQGLVTSGDQVYILEEKSGSTKRLVSVYSRATDKVYKLERGVVVPLLKGSLDMRRYYIETVTRYVIFPYKDGALIPAKEFAARYPNCWSYLKENKKFLTSREHGKMDHDGWYGYVYPKNLTLFSKPKILTPSIANRASFSYDEHGEYYFVGSGGGGGGGYGITLKSSEHSPLYVLGLLNGRLLDFYLKSISSPFRHGYYAYNKQYIERLPIRRINFSDPADKQRHDAIVALVEEMLQLQKDHAVAEREKFDQRIALKQRIEQVDKQIDALVYELYNLTAEEIKIIET